MHVAMALDECNDIASGGSGWKFVSSDNLGVACFASSGATLMLWQDIACLLYKWLQYQQACTKITGLLTVGVRTALFRYRAYRTEELVE
jgi:hypothetical protein